MPQQHDGLRAYADLLQRWNTKVNLVGRRDISNLWERHIEDALFLYQCLPPLNVAPWLLDVGTGGGLPGMVMAILDHKPGADKPEDQRNYVLADRSERKVRFLNHVVAELKLTNVRTLCGDFSRGAVERGDTGPNHQRQPAARALRCNLCPGRCSA